MTSPTETAGDHLMVQEDDRVIPITAGDPQSPDPAAPEHPGATDADSAAAEPGVVEVSDAGSPSAVVSAPDAEPGATRASPVASDSTSPDARWHEILAMFVDDPRSSIELAADLVDDSTEALVVSVKERQRALLSAWQDDNAGTEEMRIGLQQYRALWTRIEDLSREA